MQFLDWYFSEDFCTAVNLRLADVVHFTRAEQCLLGKLLAARGRVVTRGSLLDAVAGLGSDSSDRSIDFLINRLRRKLGDRARRPRYIQSRYGEGYRWIATASQRAAAEYATVAPVRTRLRGDRIMSYCDRPATDRAVLERYNESILVLRLQGCLVTETTGRVFDEVHDEIRQEPAGGGLRHLLIDFRDVQGIDGAAMPILARLRDLACHEGVALVFSSVRESMERPLRSTGVRLFASLDRALEWREDDILQHASARRSAEQRLRALLARDSGTDDAATTLAHFETIAVPPHSVIIRAASETREMFFLETGTAEVLLEIDGAWVRASRIWPGTLFGEIGFHCGGPRTATVMSIDACHLVRIRPDALDRLESQHPHAAIALHRFLARRAAKRLIFYNDMVVDFFRSTYA